jgi:DNA invertase Pin-like site-specific DNA recombinase
MSGSKWDDEIWVRPISGATTKRPALLRCLKKLEHGDTLIVWKLDRLGRSLCDLITMLDDLRARDVKFLIR